MTNEERDIISQFIARVGGAGQASGFGSGSVPAAQQQALPPIDRDADGHIGQLFSQYPEARYRITQLAFVQERALVEAQNRIKRLEWEVQQAQQAAQASQQQTRSGGGLFGGLFGGGNRQQSAPPPQGGPWNQSGPQQQYYQSAPPPPQYPPNYQPGMLPRQGSGFLGSALTTAAGVAGGLVVGNALMDLFSPHQGGLGGLGGGTPAASPWAAPAADQGQIDNGTWDNGGSAASGNQDYVDNGGWDQSSGGGSNLDQGSASDGGGWDNSGSSDGGGWDSGGSSDDTY